MYYFILFFVNWFFPSEVSKYPSVKNRHICLGYSTDSIFIFASCIIFNIENDNVLSHVPFKQLNILSYNVTYNVCYWLFKNIYGVGKVQRRRDAATPDMDFTEPIYLCKQSVTDLISVLFCWGPKVWYVNKRKIIYNNLIRSLIF